MKTDEKNEYERENFPLSEFFFHQFIIFQISLPTMNKCASNEQLMLYGWTESISNGVDYHDSMV